MIQQREFNAMIEEDRSLLEQVIMSDEAKFHLSGKINKHNVQIWESENLYTVILIECDSRKVNVIRAVLKDVYLDHLFTENTINGNLYLDMIGKLVNATTHGQRGIGIHFSTR